MARGPDLSRILIAPAPNWFCTSALALESSRGVYVYSTKNSLILATLLENRILGSIYCGVKSKPAGVAIFTTLNHLAREVLLISSTHLDNRLRFWEVTDSSLGESESPGRGDPAAPAGEVGIRLLSESLECSSLANVICFEQGLVYVGDTQGEITQIVIREFDFAAPTGASVSRLRPVQGEEITLIKGLTDPERLAVGYKSGLVAVIGRSGGDLLFLLSDPVGLAGGGAILSLLDSSQEMIISSSRVDGHLYRYCKRSETMERIRIQEALVAHADDQSLGICRDRGKAREKDKSQRVSAGLWTLLTCDGDHSCSRIGRFYATADGEIAEFELLEDCNIRLERRMSISGPGGYRARELKLGNQEVIFSALSYSSSSRSYLLGITRSKRVFLADLTEWRIEWSMDTLGGWIEELVSPSGFSHIVYILSGEGRLMGVDLLETHRKFTLRAPKCHIYESLRGFGKDERIVRVSANPIDSEYLLYSTNLGNLGVLYVNPDNISQFSNVSIRIVAGKDQRESSGKTAPSGRHSLGCRKSDLARLLAEADLDWLVLPLPPREAPSITPDEGSSANLPKSRAGWESGEGLFNSQAKLFSSLVFSESRYPVLLIYSSKQSECICLDLTPEFEQSELTLRAKAWRFGVQTETGSGGPQQHSVIRLRATQAQTGAESSSAVYFASTSPRVALGESEGAQLGMLKLGVGGDQSSESAGGEARLPLYLHRAELSVDSDSRLVLGHPSVVELQNALRSKSRRTEFGIGGWNQGLERVVGGLVALGVPGDLGEIYILATSLGAILVILSDKTACRLENIFRDKGRPNYEYFSMGMIEASGGSGSGGAKRHDFAFNLAVSNEFNQTSIIGVRVGGSLDRPGQACVRMEILLVRPNTQHRGGVNSKHHFKSKLLWYRDVRDFDNEYESNLRLLHGGQEQMLQLFDISQEVLERSSRAGMNKSSLLFLTNKSIYQQSSHASIRALTLLLEARLSRFFAGKSTHGAGDTLLEIRQLAGGSLESEVLFDLALFLNDRGASSDLIGLHLRSHSNNQLTGPRDSSGALDVCTGHFSESSKRDESRNLDLFVEYLYLLGGEIDTGSPLFQSLLGRYLGTGEAGVTETCDPSGLIRAMQSTEYDDLFGEWLRYLSHSSNRDLETDCAVKSLVLSKLDELEPQLRSFSDSPSRREVFANVGGNPNILHEYCILNVLNGRSHKAIEMYCRYNLFQCAWLVSSLYFGSEHELTLKVFRDWRRSLTSNGLILQSFKCLVAVSDLDELYEALLGRIHDLYDSSRDRQDGGRMSKERFSQIGGLFESFKLVGYYRQVSISDGEEKSNLLSKFSADIADYILLVFCREIVSLRSHVDGDYYCRSKISRERVSGLEEVIGEIEGRILQNIHLYELIVGFSSLVVSRGNRVDIAETRRFLGSFGIVTLDDLFLLQKKCSYLPFIEEIRLEREIALMRDLLILVLSLVLETDSGGWVPRAERLVGTLLDQACSRDVGPDKLDIFGSFLEALTGMFLSEKDLEALRSAELSGVTDSCRVLDEVSQLWGGVEFRGEPESRQVLALKYDLCMVGILAKLSRTAGGSDSDSVENSTLSEALDESDLELLRTFVSQDEQTRRLVGNSVVYNSVLKMNNNSRVVWLYARLNSAESRTRSQELGLKIREVAHLTKKQYLKSDG
ncbi:hypothetical protein OJ253_3396 [Cryptosporidium canis]|uniref:Uncharacterized protein n=1 Tax=Cryptosporidium canis TaxID=195482 RepID=A0A9D5DE08_9CRYT|nr:hypothetical protein OJ253_3396 [Cryptosporidium canis]